MPIKHVPATSRRICSVSKTDRSGEKLLTIRIIDVFVAVLRVIRYCFLAGRYDFLFRKTVPQTAKWKTGHALNTVS